MNTGQITDDISPVDLITLAHISQYGVDILTIDEDGINLRHQWIHLCFAAIDALQMRKLVIDGLLLVWGYHDEDVVREERTEGAVYGVLDALTQDENQANGEYAYK